MANFDSGVTQDIVHSALSDLDTAAKDLLTQLQSDFNSFVTTISEHWASKQAVEIFNGPITTTVQGDCKPVKESYESIVQEIVRCIQSINSSVNSAAAKKLADGWDEYDTKVCTLTADYNVDFSKIVDNINGSKGIDKDEASAASNTLASKDYSVYITNINNSLVDSGISGSDIQSTLNESVRTITQACGKDIDDLNTNIQAFVTATVQAYGDSDGAIKEAFTLSK